MAALLMRLIMMADEGLDGADAAGGDANGDKEGLNLYLKQLVRPPSPFSTNKMMKKSKQRPSLFSLPRVTQHTFFFFFFRSR